MPVHDVPELRDRLRAFRDRAHAGEALATFLLGRVAPSIVLAVPAGGVPVGAVLGRRLGLRLDLVVVSKITPSWNSEVGYGAVAFDGTVRLNEAMVGSLGVDESEIRAGTRRTLEKVFRRVSRFRGARPLPDLSAGTAILVDDGLASGFTMRVAVQAVWSAGASSVVVAVPTAHRAAAEAVAAEVDAVYCANLRTRVPFAVADAYEAWSDLDDDDVARILAEAHREER